MTPAEIKDRIEAFAKSIGPKAYVSISVSTGSDTHGLVIASLWPESLTGEHHVTVRADTFAKALDKLEAAWDDARDLADKNTIRKMALAIIEITGDQGRCSDAALRGAGFSQQQIDRLGSRACAEATRLASGGPFEIVRTAGANAPEMESVP
jgi:hypothetical protein